MKYLTIALALAVALMIPYLDNLRSERADLVAKVFDYEAKAAQVAQAMDARDAIDSQYAKDLLHARLENDTLRDAVASGSKRLRIKATCPSVSNPTSAPRLADGGDAELAESARQDYHDLRASIIEKESQLAGLQAYVTQVCLMKPKEAK
jgi:prophage endopeptidase